MPDAGWYRWDGDDLVLQLTVRPKASRDEFAGAQGSRYRVRITAPPVDGRANAHLVRFLARAFGVSRSAITLEAGETSREKRVRIRAPACLPVDGLAPPGTA